MTEGLLTRELYSLIAPALLHAWRVFVPRGTRGPQLDMRRLNDTIAREGQALGRVAETGKSRDFDHYLGSGPQPHLAFMLSTKAGSDLSNAFTGNGLE
ncbi:MAG: hypothetical protein KJ072_26405, partial [Verrucomicrobia bacterium]|nr:hypothetical protein [Verrucomicrobiota bacterium]